MSLFSKQPTEPQKNPEIEALKADVETIKASVAKDGEETQKQMVEICSALNILDADIAALKEEKSAPPTPPRDFKELKEMRSAVESLALIGRLCLQNKADFEVLSKRLDYLEKRQENASAKSPAKILN